MQRPEKGVWVLASVCALSLALNAWLLSHGGARTPGSPTSGGADAHTPQPTGAGPPVDRLAVQSAVYSVPQATAEVQDPLAVAHALCQQFREGEEMLRQRISTPAGPAPIQRQTVEELRNAHLYDRELEALQLDDSREAALLEALAQSHVDFMQAVQAGTANGVPPGDFRTQRLAAALGPEVAQRFEQVHWKAVAEGNARELILAMANSDQPLTATQRDRLLEAYVELLKQEAVRARVAVAAPMNPLLQETATVYRAAKESRARTIAPLVDEAAAFLEPHQLTLFKAAVAKGDRELDQQIEQAVRDDAEQAALLRQGGCL